MRTPDIPGRSTPHSLCLAGLHALQEVVVLLLHTRGGRPVEKLVFGHRDLVVFIMSGLKVLSCRILEENPRKEAFREKMVVFSIMDKNSVVKGGV